ncbi:Septum formation initiator [Elusimicrobium minutum Pei191]|uniref:Septum formation initiator n=1 Tax=Elusimicrobium minutum (strain Pei191) TaxID=445932 RepID=B2KBA6_ELUMP|nr:septum formation initiator family protein [Elusimicrobium minutum]ACC97928.1 Septum formation initiator [Elusimicrobium minutum Pei191]
MDKFINNVKKKLKPRHIILAAMVLFVLFNGSLYGLIHNRIELAKLRKRNIELDKEFAELEKQLGKLESGDKKYLEDIARVKYHLSKPGEIEFRLVTQNKKSGE